MVHQCINKIPVYRISILDHLPDLGAEHSHHFLIGNGYVAFGDLALLFDIVRLDIAYSQQQGPKAVLISV